MIKLSNILHESNLKEMPSYKKLFKINPRWETLMSDFEDQYSNKMQKIGYRSLKPVLKKFENEDYITSEQLYTALGFPDNSGFNANLKKDLLRSGIIQEFGVRSGQLDVPKIDLPQDDEEDIFSLDVPTTSAFHKNINYADELRKITTGYNITNIIIYYTKKTEAENLPENISSATLSQDYYIRLSAYDFLKTYIEKGYSKKIAEPVQITRRDYGRYNNTFPLKSLFNSPDDLFKFINYVKNDHDGNWWKGKLKENGSRISFTPNGISKSYVLQSRDEDYEKLLPYFTGPVSVENITISAA